MKFTYLIEQNCSQVNGTKLQVRVTCSIVSVVNDHNKVFSEYIYWFTVVINRMKAINTEVRFTKFKKWGTEQKESKLHSICIRFY